MNERKIVTVWANGGSVCLGRYEAENEADALDQCARRNGYRCWADVRLGDPLKVRDENEPPTALERQQQQSRRMLATVRWNAQRRRGVA